MTSRAEDRRLYTNKVGWFLMEGKGNDGKGDTPERDLWRTKQELIKDGK